MEDTRLPNKILFRTSWSEERKVKKNQRRTDLTAYGQTYLTVYGQKKSNHLTEINLIPNFCQRQIGPLLLLFLEMQHFEVKDRCK